MYKRLISLIITLALVLSISPTGFMYSYAAQTDVQQYGFYRDGSIAIDGVLESRWKRFVEITDGNSFAVLWDVENFYLALHGNQSAETVAVTLNGVSLIATNGSVKKAGVSIIGADAKKSDTAWELKIPFSAVDYTLSSYSQEISLTLDAAGSHWTGSVVFMQENCMQVNSFGTVATYEGSSGYCIGDDSSVAEVTGNTTDSAAIHYKMDHTKVSDSANITHRYQVIANGTKGSDVGESINVLEFDFKPQSMPVQNAWRSSNNDAYPCNGFVLINQLGDLVNNTTDQGYAIGITNLNGNLTLVIRTEQNSDGTYGKTFTVADENWQGSTYRIRLEYIPQTQNLTAWANGIYLGTTDVAPKAIQAAGKIGFLLYDRGKHGTDYGTTEFIVNNISSGVIGGEGSVPGLLLAIDLDKSPATNAGSVGMSAGYILNKSNNSIVLDLTESKKINVVKLTDTDKTAIWNREAMSLWVSTDNESYTKVKDFKLLHDGQNWYLYDFVANCQYVKIHYNHFDSGNADFVISAMDAHWQDIFGLGTGTLLNSTVTYTNTTGKTMQDETIRVSKTSAGISGDVASIRVMLGDSYLYHYIDGDDICVRVPDIAVGETVTFTIIYGTQNAINTADKEAVLEITYGDKETYITNSLRWLYTLPAGEYTNGTVTEDILLSWRRTDIQASYDNGNSWHSYTKLSNEIIEIISGINDIGAGGWMFDAVTGRVLYECHNLVEGDTDTSYNIVLYSDDFGKTWKAAKGVSGQNYLDPHTVADTVYPYALSYSNGIMTSAYDGAGPNVDFVFPTGVQINEYVSFNCMVAYSCDAGLTWQYSQNMLTYGAAGTTAESGVSEGWIMENEEGTLVLYARYQETDSQHFAVYYSYDFGIHWTSKSKDEWTENPEQEGATIEGVLSDVYTSNTQPVLMKFSQSNGGEAPLLIWGGNNALGGSSYQRHPLNVAVSHDGLNSWDNIQNLFDGTFLNTWNIQGCVVNPSVIRAGEDLVMTFQNNYAIPAQFRNVYMRVSDFENWFYRTKGAYDAFEDGNIGAEDWTMWYGTVDTTKANGSYVMRIQDASAVSRPIPQLRKGKIQFDIYVPSGTSPTTIALQPALSYEKGTYSLAEFVIRPGSITCGSSSVAISYNTWYTITVDLSASTMTVNGNTVDIVLNSNVEDYVCYVTILKDNTSLFNSYTYVDNFTVISDTNPSVYSAAKYHAAQVGDVTYRTLEEAVRESNGNCVKLLNNSEESLTIDGAVLIDLNGKVLSGSISGIGTLQFIDSENNDYNGYGYLTADIADGIEVSKVCNIDGRTYVRIGEKGDYSFHRIYVKITDSVMRPDYRYNRVASPGIFFKYVIAGDDIVTSQITQYGVAVVADFSKNILQSDVLNMNALTNYHAHSSVSTKIIPGSLHQGNGLMVYGIMKETNTSTANKVNAETAVWGRAYVQLADGTQIFSDNCMGGTLRSFIEDADDLWDDQKLSSEQQQALAQMYQMFKDVVDTFDINQAHILEE